MQYPRFVWIHTSPRWAGKHNGILGQRLQPLLENIKAIALDPPDFGCYAIDLGIMTCTGKRCRVFLNSEDLFEATRQSESDGVAAGTSKGVYYDRL